MLGGARGVVVLVLPGGDGRAAAGDAELLAVDVQLRENGLQEALLVVGDVLGLPDRLERSTDGLEGLLSFIEIRSGGRQRGGGRDDSTGRR